MTIPTVKLVACRWAALTLCALTLPALAQRAGGGGGGGGGFGGGGGGGFGGARGGAAASSSTTSPIDRPGNGEVGSANFYVDKDTGQVFIIADDATTAYVSQVISNLAKPKPQVLIKVVFLEVDYNKGTDIGVEGTVTKTLHAGLANTASSEFNLASQGTANTPGITTLQGAGLYSIVGDDFTATLRAIEEVGKVDVLSRPTILARNNQMASISVGYQYPLVTGIIAATVATGPQTVITYTSVGISLNVTPNITSDGMVEMIVAPTISSVDPSISQVIGTTSTNGNATPISAPAIATESANTVVVTPDGQTVVIGGLMKNNRSSTDSKIPLLGDIPLFGQVFHHKVSSVTKQELIILMTPYVVRTPADLARMSQDERGRAKMAPKAFPQSELNQFLESGKPAPPPAPTRMPPIANPTQ
jgi:type II secretory pathway component GspD/PulD (secretin)